MKRLALLMTLPAFLLVQYFGVNGSLRTGDLHARTVKEKTIKADGSTIRVRVIPKAEVLKVRPYIKAKKGKKKGRLWLEVVIKNTGDKPQRYSVFGQGKTKSGGWKGGSKKSVPKKGKLAPGKQTKVKVKTRYKGKTVPKEILVEIFPALSKKK